MRSEKVKYRVQLVAALAIALMFTGSLPSVAASDKTGSVWLPYWYMSTARPAVVKNSDLFKTASPFWYNATGCTKIVGYNGAGDRATIKALHDASMRVVPTVTATGITPQIAIQCLGNVDARAVHVAEVLRVMRSRDYDGIEIDYEHLANISDATKIPKVKSAINAFVRDLCTKVKAANKSCVITVLARTSDSPGPKQGNLRPEVFDYSVVAGAASRMRVMAYDQHTRLSGPGPIAGLPWVQRIVSYIKAETSESKVELGVPTYGRDWSSAGVRTLVKDQARALARKYSVTPKYDAVQHEYTFTYKAAGITHTVWFSGARAVADRKQLASVAGLAGAAYWAAGQEEPGTWKAVRAR